MKYRRNRRKRHHRDARERRSSNTIEVLERQRHDLDQHHSEQIQEATTTPRPARPGGPNQ